MANPVTNKVTPKKKPHKVPEKVIPQTVGKVKIAKIVEKKKSAIKGLPSMSVKMEVSPPRREPSFQAESEGLKFVDKKVADKIGEQLLARIISGEKYGNVNLENWGTGMIGYRNPTGATVHDDSFQLLNRVVTKEVVNDIEILVVEEHKATPVYPNSVILLYTRSQQNPDKSWATTSSMTLIPNNEIKEIFEDGTENVIDRVLVSPGKAHIENSAESTKVKTVPPIEKVKGFTPGKGNFAELRS